MVPRLAGWDWERIDPELRKSFDVALHAGAAMALLVTRRHEIADELKALDGRRVMVLTLSFLPAAAVGYRFERTIESRLGGPRSTAAGLVAGAVLMALADRRPQRRGHGDAGAADGLALGIGQAAALMPGVSRNGATLTAARLRGFDRDQANLLSRTVALPVILGAVALKGTRLARRGTTKDQRKWLAIGVATSFVSTVASNGLIAMVERDRALFPYSAYRVAFAALILARLGMTRRARSGPSVVESQAMNGVHPSGRERQPA
jgi:undecaprenyl-diphosphatase